MHQTSSLVHPAVKAHCNRTAGWLTIVPDFQDWGPCSVGLLSELFSWTDCDRAGDTWERLLIAAPNMTFQDVRDEHYMQAWHDFAAKHPSISVQVAVNTPMIQKRIVDPFLSLSAETLVIIHLYTKEYFDFYEKFADKLHPSLLDPWLDMLRHIIPGASYANWKLDAPRSLQERFAASEFKVRAELDAVAPQQVCLLYPHPQGGIANMGLSFELPRVG